MRFLLNFSLFVGTLFCLPSMAVDIEWSGIYRIEGVSIQRPDLANGDRELDYGLHHLILRPKIVAGDGLTIRSQIEIFNASAYPNSHMGQIFGSDIRGTNQGITGSKDESNVFSDNGKAGTIKASQLYLTYDFEYGSLIVGRAPLHFGLGMKWNSGMGLFDHWYDAVDLVGYKIVFGNLFILPMYGKLSSGMINKNDDVDAYMIQVQYDMPDVDTEMGIFFQLKRANDQGSDAPLKDAAGQPIIGGANSNHDNSVGIQTINVFALKDNQNWRLGAEGSFQSGQTGVRTAGGDRVTLGGFGLATELEYHPFESSWKWGLKAGVATGDDPASDASFEGYLFNRNYDVAFLLFNHPLGQYDVFRTRLVGGGGGVIGTPTEISQTDVDTISNVFYFAPYSNYRMSDRWNLKGVLATGILNVDPKPNGNAVVSKNVGWEFDLSLNFAPRKGITWINEMGLFFPGDAFKGDGSFKNDFTYGFQTKAAISF